MDINIMRKKYIWLIILAVILLVVIVNVTQKKPSELAPEQLPGKRWVAERANPLLSNTKLPKSLSSIVTKNAVLMIWNDPSVLKEGLSYSMWASLGTQGGESGVSIYKLSSTDGINWTVANNGESVLTPGDKQKGEPDWIGVETPAVIKVGSTYHMYYSFYPEEKKPMVSMAHAVSSDGINWQKLGALTSLTEVVGKPEGNNWGWLARAEPTVVYYNGLFYLYFTDVKCREPNCRGGSPPAIRGISLATSKDGQNFTKQGPEPVLLQSQSYPATEGWEGYSTPWVLHNGSEFELFVDVFRKVGDDDDESVQTAIARYRSGDGIHFEEVEANIVVAGQQPWAAASVRAPSVIDDNGIFKMWYAGDGFNPKRNTPKDALEGRVNFGIGMATP